MKLLCLSCLLFAVCFTASAQGTIGRLNFANYVPGVVDAPIWNLQTQTGPGAGFSAQLYLVRAGGSLTPLVPASTFLTTGVGYPDVASGRYWEPQIVEVPGFAPGNDLNFMVRVWRTSFGSFDAARNNSIEWGESAHFTATLGGETPGILVDLQAFAIGLPEPSALTLFGLGLVPLLLRLRRRG